jgi:hypothetical protein
MHFFTFMHCGLNWFAYSFVVVHFLNIFSTDWKLVGNYAFLYVFNFERNVLCHISTFCELCSTQRLKKSKKVFFKCVLEFSFASITGSVFFIFFKKVGFVVPYPTSHFFSRPLKICLRYCYE